MKTLDVEVLSVGKWKGREYTAADLEQLAANHALLAGRVKPPLKFGHDDGQTLAGQSDGDPALGWVSALRVEGDKLIATVSDMPDLVRNAIENRLYRRVSSEIAVGVKLNDKPIGMVLVGLALLGADLPAVDNLQDLQAYLSDNAAALQNALGAAQRVSFTYQPEVRDMPEEIKMDAAEVERLREIAKKSDAQSVELIQLREKNRVDNFLHAKDKLLNSLETRVKEKKLLPATRGKVEGLVLAQQGKFAGELIFTGDQVLDLLSEIEAKVPGTVTDEKATAGGTADLPKGFDKDPGAELDLAVQRLMFGDKTLDYAAATRHVMAVDPALAQRYKESRNAFAQEGIRKAAGGK